MKRKIAFVLMGTSLVLFLCLPAWAEDPPPFLASWGSYGTGDGQFRYPYGVATDSVGNVYATDRQNHRIQKFDSDGNFLTKWGTQGTGDGQFRYPIDVETDGMGNVYVVGEYEHRIQKFDSNGNFLTKWGTYGSADGQFNTPRGVATDGEGNVYVADALNGRIQKFDSNGNFLTKWGTYGSADGQFRFPHNVATDSAGNVYVVDQSNHRIQKFDSDGNFLTKWGTEGTGDGQLSGPIDVATDGLGNVYVADSFNHRIQKFDGDGNFLTKWGSWGSGDGQFDLPTGMATDSVGNVYVAEINGQRIQKFGTTADQVLIIEGDTTWRAIGPFGNLEGTPIASVGEPWESDNVGWNFNLAFDDSNAAGWQNAIINRPLCRDQGGVSDCIWVDGNNSNGSSPSYYRKTFEIDGTVVAGSLGFSVDDDAQVYINGNLVLDDQSGHADGAQFIDVTPYLQNGTNLAAIKAHDSWGGGEAWTFELTVDIQPLIFNTPPVAHDQAVATDEDVPVDIVLVGDDPDGDALTFAVTSGPANGQLSAFVQDGWQLYLTYTPSPGFYGNDSFSFVVNDGRADSAEATVAIAVAHVVADDVVLQGTVTDRETGIPIAGALVNRGFTTLTTTDANGYYELSGDQIANGYSLLFEAEGYFLSPPVSFDLELPLPNTLNIDLLPSVPVVQGVVRDALTGLPIPGAQIFPGLTYYVGRYLPNSDGTGFFSIASSSFLEYVHTHLQETDALGTLGASADGYLDGYSPVTVTLPIPLTADVSLIPLADTVLQGTITDREIGLPISGAVINQGLATTDASGSYSLTGDQLGSADGYLTIQAEDYFGRADIPYKLEGPLPNTLDVDLAPGGPIIQGLVRNAVTATPISGATVGLNTHHALRRLFSTDVNGFFSVDSSNFREEIIPYLQEGRSIGHLSASASGFLYDTSGAIVSTPLPLTANIDLIPGTETVLQGMVTDRETGLPIAGALINRGLKVTDANGVFSLTGGELGSVGGYLVIHAKGYFATNANMRYRLELPLPNILDIDLAPGGTVVHGYVRDAFTGAPITSARLSTRLSNFFWTDNLTTDSDGYYFIDSSNFREEIVPQLQEENSIGSVTAYHWGFLHDSAPVIVSIPLPLTADLELLCLANCFTESDTDTIADEIDNCPTVNNEQQSNMDEDEFGDLCDPCPNDPLDQCDASGSAAGEMTPEEGGTLTTPDGGLTISADPGDLPEDTTVTVTETNKDGPEVNVTVGSSPGIGNALAVYDLEPDGLVFTDSIWMTLTAIVTDLVADDKQAKQIKKLEDLQDKLDIYLLEEDAEGNEIFVAQGANCSIDEEPVGTFKARCTAKVTHFSTYALIAPLDSDGDGVSDNFFPDFDLCPNTPLEQRTFNNVSELLIATDSEGVATVLLEALVSDDEGFETEDVGTFFTLVGASNGAVFNCFDTSDWYGEAACIAPEVPADVYQLTINGLAGCTDGTPGEALLVVFDPETPKATGGGYILPDAESTVPAGSDADKAHFGFVVEIDKNEAAAGNLRFQYQAAGIKLKSESMTWYTVSHNKAMFSGTANINGSGLYTFRVMATDGDKAGGSPDAFDITIWSGTDTEGDPIHRAKNDLAGGSIVVHRR